MEGNQPHPPLVRSQGESILADVDRDVKQEVSAFKGRKSRGFL
jgi:hypothetical protein